MASNIYNSNRIHAHKVEAEASKGSASSFKSGRSRCNQLKRKKLNRKRVCPSVTFASELEICPLLNLEEYTEQELKACWYSQNEYAKITKKSMKIILKIQRGQTEDAKRYCTTGLERMTPAEQDLKELLRMKAYIAVLEEQNEQIKVGIADPEKIAHAYTNAAGAKSQKAASKRGERDAIAVYGMTSKACKSTFVSKAA